MSARKPLERMSADDLRGQVMRLATKCDTLAAALRNASDALSDFYIVNGRNTSSTYNTVQILADARAALAKVQP